MSLSLRLRTRVPAARIALALLLATGAMASPLLAGEQQPPQPTVQPPVPPKETGQDLRKLPPSEPPKPGEPVREVPDLKHTGMPSKRGPAIPELLAGDLRRLPALAPWPPGKSVQIVRSATGRHALQFMDGAFAVHEVSGALAAGPFSFESLWSNDRDPGACKAVSDQPLAIRYDQRAGRWLLSRWARPEPGSAFHLCAALSRTADPVAGGWYLYDLPLPMYLAGTALEPEVKTYSLVIDLGGAQALFAFDRARMLAGDPVELIRTPPDRQRPPQQPQNKEVRR